MSPQLSKDEAEKVEGSSSSFDPLPEDTYAGSLVSVKVGEGRKGPYWTWEFDVIEPDDYEGRKLWVNTSLAENARWKLNEVFQAFGVTADTDTDELVGNVVKLVVVQRVIEQGARKGQIGNNVDTVLPYDGEATGGGGDGAPEVW